MAESPERTIEPIALRAPEAAAALGISPRKFREISHHVPGVYLPGTRIRVYPLAALRDWLHSLITAQDGEVHDAVGEALSALSDPSFGDEGSLPAGSRNRRERE